MVIHKQYIIDSFLFFMVPYDDDYLIVEERRTSVYKVNKSRSGSSDDIEAKAGVIAWVFVIASIVFFFTFII